MRAPRHAVMNERPPEEPATLEEWLWRIREYDRTIFVREKISGHWRTVALASVSPRCWAAHVAQWLKDGVLPVRVRTSEELDGTR